MSMRRVLLLSAVALASVARAQTPGAENATRAVMQHLCTELSMPCSSCGGRRGPGTPAPTPQPAENRRRHPVDGWGHPLQISVGGGGIRLRSPGADGELGTSDDLVKTCGETEPAE